MQPVWRGNRIFYYSQAKVWSADVTASGASVTVGTPKTAFTAPVIVTLGHGYDVSRDGKKFLLSVTQQISQAPLTLVINWQEELKK